MTQRTPYVILSLLLATAASAQEPKALDYLNQTRDGVLAAVKGLTPAQWNFKPAPDRWSIAEILEHITVVEEFVAGMTDKLPELPPPAANFNAAKMDALILAKMPDRSTKAQAPPEIQPSGRWTTSEALKHFTAGNQRLSAALDNTPELRKHVAPHPVFGPLDGYEWILLVAAHNERHTQQMLEVKADPRYPR